MIDPIVVEAAEQMSTDELTQAAAAHQANERRALLAGDLDAAKDHAVHRFLCLTILENRS
ncbi:hypothetical protein GS894_23825 [Rhodococcus hoagii]|nr:hypothetical protein [Prescottella equi]NKT12022.1 hypothetical protein [Prescottella equi]NKT16258.1 hypothetical protein [Prescottella equi]NKT36053.1 hypothetical protein [Prescottella equi]NKT37655.1 hypothetical protein [Prescottella equi]